MRWFFALVMAAILGLNFEAVTFACGGCLFGGKAETQENEGAAKKTKAPNLAKRDVRYECPTCKVASIKIDKCPKCGIELNKDKKD